MNLKEHHNLEKNYRILFLNLNGVLASISEHCFRTVVQKKEYSQFRLILVVST